jgi:hypothetical protein
MRVKRQQLPFKSVAVGIDLSVLSLRIRGGIQMKKKARATPIFRTLRVTEAEKALIDKAAKICGWPDGDSALFARQLLLGYVEGLVKDDRRSRTPGARLRQRLRYLNQPFIED